MFVGDYETPIEVILTYEDGILIQQPTDLLDAGIFVSRTVADGELLWNYADIHTRSRYLGPPDVVPSASRPAVESIIEATSTPPPRAGAGLERPPRGLGDRRDRTPSDIPTVVTVDPAGNQSGHLAERRQPCHRADMTFALVLGGGGSVGIAWEVGVLAGLADAGIDAASAELIVGTSAGSVVGTHLRQGRSIDTLVANQRQPATGGGSSDALDPDLTPLIEIFGILQEAGRRTPEVLHAVGEKAIAADTPPEAEWIGRFEGIVGGDEWPAGDLRITAVDCATGLRRVWTAVDGVDLAPAVASSCAIPGVFPPITLEGSRYTDGGLWSSSNLDVVLETNVDAALFVGPLRAGDPTAARSLEREIDLVASGGRRAEAIVPGEVFATEIGAHNLMNPAFLERGVELGIDDGTAAAARVHALLG